MVLRPDRRGLHEPVPDPARARGPGALVTIMPRLLWADWSEWKNSWTMVERNDGSTGRGRARDDVRAGRLGFLCGPETGAASRVTASAPEITSTWRACAETEPATRYTSSLPLPASGLSRNASFATFASPMGSPMREVIGHQASVMIASTSAMRASIAASSPPHWPQITSGMSVASAGASAEAVGARCGGEARSREPGRRRAGSRRWMRGWSKRWMRGGHPRRPRPDAGANTLPGSVGRTR